MSKVIAFFKSIPELIWSALAWLLDSLGYAISWTFYTIYDGFLVVIYSFADAIDFSAVMFNAAAQYSDMPALLVWLVNQVALPQAMTYIAGALVIRLLLNLIPSVVTRI